MTLRAVLIAHAPTGATASAAFPQDEKLDERGRMKAAALAAPLRYGGRIFFAPERRTRETAAALGLAGVAEPALRDCGYGLWAGRSIADLHAKDPRALASWLSDPQFRPPGGESMTELVARVGAWLDLQAKDDGRIIGVTHPAVLRGAVLHAVGAPPEAFWRITAAPLSEARLAHDG
jgi:broad specificity phosphatase PhoE